MQLGGIECPCNENSSKVNVCTVQGTRLNSQPFPGLSMMTSPGLGLRESTKSCILIVIVNNVEVEQRTTYCSPRTRRRLPFEPTSPITNLWGEFGALACRLSCQRTQVHSDVIDYQLSDMFHLASRAIPQARFMPLPGMHDRQSSSPRQLQNLNSRSNSFGDCIKMSALYLAKPAWFDEVALEVD